MDKILVWQRRNAEVFVDEATACGHDIGVLDVLDILASRGLYLIDVEGPATAVYFDALVKEWNEAQRAERS